MKTTKKCNMCNIEFNDNPFIYCNECMEIDNAIINRLKKTISKEDEIRIRKALEYLRQDTNEIMKAE